MTEKKKILLVDDSEVDLLSTKSMLSKEYEVNTAKSCKEALNQLINKLVPELLVLDILMPEMDGWETFNKIKGISLLRDVPIAFVTSITGATEEERAFNMGVNDYIRKPYSQKELLERVKTLLEKNI
jgi:PleD family two-component response regulator